VKKEVFAALPYAIFLLLAAVSWNRWIEPYVDSGRELMVPSRIAHGEALYRDVRFYHGPLAPYLAAGIDALFGRSLAARIAFAAAIALAHLEALRRLAGRFLLPARASLSVAGIVVTAFFLRPGGQLFPFSFDTSIAVAVIAWALHLASGRPAGERDWTAGLFLTFALLCRPEMGIAAVLVMLWEARLSRRLFALVFAPAAVAAVVYAVLSIGTPFETLRREGWLAIVGPPESFRNVYAAFAGFDQPALRLAELAVAVLLLALVASLLVVAAFLERAAPAGKRMIEAAAVLLLLAVAATAWRPPESLAEAFGLFPPLVRIVPAVAVAAAATRGLRRLVGRRPEKLLCDVPDAILFTAALFGLRLFLAAGYVGPYNAFLLPLPLLVTAVALFYAADRARASAGDALPRLLAGALVIFFFFRAASLAAQYRRPGWSRVETPVGSLSLLEPVAGATRQTLADLSTRVPRHGTLVGFPEGGFFIYALDLRNPLPQEQFFPGHLDSELEDETIHRLEARPPDAVLLCNVIAAGHGSRAFGINYLVRLDRFLRERFASAASFGPGAGPDARIGEPQFFVEVRVPRAQPSPPH
jgi:hypothetical protein